MPTPATDDVYDCVVLSGGGAKGAYGAGVLKALHEYRKKKGIQTKICYIGTSAGALNAAVAASAGADALVKFWRGVDTKSVLGLTFGPMPKFRAALKGAKGLVWDSPYAIYNNKALSKLIETNIALDPVITKDCHLIVAATNYTTGELQAFYTASLVDSLVAFDAKQKDQDRRLRHWKKVKDQAYLTKVLLASAAIPLAFPPVTIDDQQYIDGGVGNHTPTREAAYFLRYLSTLNLGKIGQVFCVMQDPLTRLIDDDESLDALQISLRTLDVYNYAHTGPIVDGWYRINREVRKFREAIDGVKAVLDSVALDDATRTQLYADLDAKLSKLTGATPRNDIPMLRIDPSTALGDTLDFAPLTIKENIKRGYADFVKTLHDRDFIDDAERTALLGISLEPAK